MSKLDTSGSEDLKSIFDQSKRKKKEKCFILIFGFFSSHAKIHTFGAGVEAEGVDVV